MGWAVGDTAARVVGATWATGAGLATGAACATGVTWAEATCTGLAAWWTGRAASWW